MDIIFKRRIYPKSFFFFFIERPTSVKIFRVTVRFWISRMAPIKASIIVLVRCAKEWIHEKL